MNLLMVFVLALFYGGLLGWLVANPLADRFTPPGSGMFREGVVAMVVIVALTALAMVLAVVTAYVYQAL